NGTDFEISLDGTNYDSGLELEDYNGEVTTIYARLKSGLAIGSYTDEISILGDNAEEIIVALEGSVTPYSSICLTENFGNADLAYQYNDVTLESGVWYFNHAMLIQTVGGNRA